MKIKIGWTWDSTIFDIPEAAAFDPEPIKARKDNADQDFAYGRCPAVLMFLQRSWLIRSPYDLTAHVDIGPDGNAKLSIDKPDKNTANRFFYVETPDRWRSFNMPVIQLCLPLVFFSDKPVLMEAIPPIFHYNPQSIPGIIVPGSFDIHAWQRPVNCAIEWHDLNAPLVIKRGDPLFYVRFHSNIFDDTFSLQRVEMHNDLRRAIDYTKGVSRFAKRTFSLFEKARRIRARKLLK